MQRIAIILTVLVSLGAAGCSSDAPVTNGLCGNGVIDPGESCDQGNAVSNIPPMFAAGDSCTARDSATEGLLRCGACQVDEGLCVPRGACPADTPATCGNGIVDPGESCDQGNPAGGISPNFGGQTCALLNNLTVGPLQCDCCSLRTDLCMLAAPMGGNGG